MQINFKMYEMQVETGCDNKPLAIILTLLFYIEKRSYYY
jgi:hypothetical protein